MFTAVIFTFTFMKMEPMNFFHSQSKNLRVSVMN